MRTAFRAKSEVTDRPSQLGQKAAQKAAVFKFQPPCPIKHMKSENLVEKKRMSLMPRAFP